MRVIRFDTGVDAHGRAQPNLFMAEESTNARSVVLWAVEVDVEVIVCRDRQAEDLSGPLPPCRYPRLDAEHRVLRVHDRSQTDGNPAANRPELGSTRIDDVDDVRLRLGPRQLDLDHRPKRRIDLSRRWARRWQGMGHDSRTLDPAIAHLHGRRVANHHDLIIVIIIG